MREKSNACRIFVGKPERKVPLGRLRRNMVDNNKMDLREIRWNAMDWINMAQVRDQMWVLVNTVMNFQVP
jgi:hypothetical protein